MITKFGFVLLCCSLAVFLVSCGKSSSEEIAQVESTEDIPSFSTARSSHSLNGFNVSVKGLVKSDTGGSISGAKVRSALLRCNGDKTGTTSSNGKYSIGLRGGSCNRDRDSVKVCVNATHYKENCKSKSSVRDGTTVTLDFILQAK